MTDWLTEDIFHYVLADGTILDVGWYPDGDPAGHFRCRLVARDEVEAWAAPLDVFTSPDFGAVLHWLLAHVKPARVTIIAEGIVADGVTTSSGTTIGA